MLNQEYVRLGCSSLGFARDCLSPPLTPLRAATGGVHFSVSRLCWRRRHQCNSSHRRGVHGQRPAIWHDAAIGKRCSFSTGRVPGRLVCAAASSHLGLHTTVRAIEWPRGGSASMLGLSEFVNGGVVGEMCEQAAPGGHASPLVQVCCRNEP